MSEHFTKKALVGTAILMATVIVSVTIANIWVTPKVARLANGTNTNPPATA